MGQNTSFLYTILCISVCNRIFGSSCHSYKDEDYNQKTRECNLVVIHTAKNGTFVDDTEDIFVTDGSLERELKRINQYKDFGTF